METLTIGQLARKARVNLETIRFYERRGLLDKPPRNESGHRQYSEEAVRRTEFIKRSKNLGFSLKEILEILSLRVEPGRTCADIKTRAEAKIADIEQRIADLNQMREALSKLADQCSVRGQIGICPIIEALDK